MTLTPLETTFLDLVAFDEVYPHEKQVLDYIKKRLDKAKIPWKQDKTRNIIARVNGGDAPALALVGHTDIAAPLAGRKVVIEPGVIKTDGTGLLGADDKAAVAIMLELADQAHSNPPASPVELIFTVGEESGTQGAKGLTMELVESRRMLVLDWAGSVANIVTKSPAYGKIDVEYIGRDAHPAEWQEGKNAGAALIEAAGSLQQGEYRPGITCNIGVFNFGNARNKVPGQAALQAEIRSFDTHEVETAGAEIKAHFESVAKARDIKPVVSVTVEAPAYQLNQSGELFAQLVSKLREHRLEPNLQPTYGCFDGNILASRNIEVIMLGVGGYNPHSPGEHLNRTEFAEALAIMLAVCR